jgi:hypothetical protein
LELAERGELTTNQDDAAPSDRVTMLQIFVVIALLALALKTLEIISGFIFPH